MGELSHSYEQVINFEAFSSKVSVINGLLPDYIVRQL